jgi:hypothetical protein
VQHLTGEVAGALRGEEDDGLRDVLELGHRTIERAMTELLTHRKELVAGLDADAVRGFGAVLAALTEALS